MATRKSRHLSDHSQPALFPTPAPEVHSYCSQGRKGIHACLQCLRRTLEHWGYDADAYDREAKRAQHRLHSRNQRARDYARISARVSHSSRLLKFGITAQEFVALLERQGHVCALCKKPETVRRKGTLRALNVDHDHETGNVRGLLCSSCNLALGHLEKLGLPWFFRAHAYLERYVRGNEASGAA